jgi:hypothetical protein
MVLRGVRSNSSTALLDLFDVVLCRKPRPKERPATADYASGESSINVRRSYFARRNVDIGRDVVVE